jgi:peptidyl-tRNA hydrolase, PTH1 family
MPIGLIVGLGNPGATYEKTRHNVGFWLIDALATKYKSTWKQELQLQAEICKALICQRPILLAKPQSYMNLSGHSIQKICHYFKIPAEGVLICCDDVSFPIGQIKVTMRAGSAGHNGAKSVFDVLGPGVTRYRIGVGNPLYAIKNYVLGKFSDDEQRILDTQSANFLQEIEVLVDKGPNEGMNVINSKYRKLWKSISTEPPLF